MKYDFLWPLPSFKFHISWASPCSPPVEAEAKPRNQQQQTEHLAKIHAILEQLPEAEKAIYQRFGFAERARMYKLVDYETDPVKMQTIICTMIKAISEGKDDQA